MTVMPTSAIATVESMNGGPMIALIATSSESPAAKHRDHRDHRLRKRRRDCGEDRAHRTFTEANAVPGPHSTAFVKRNSPARMAPPPRTSRRRIAPPRWAGRPRMGAFAATSLKALPSSVARTPRQPWEPRTTN
jgi:hypothetical protein